MTTPAPGAAAPAPETSAPSTATEPSPIPPTSGIGTEAEEPKAGVAAVLRADLKAARSRIRKLEAELDAARWLASERHRTIEALRGRAEPDLAPPSSLPEHMETSPPPAVMATAAGGTSSECGDAELDRIIHKLNAPWRPEEDTHALTKRGPLSPHGAMWPVAAMEGSPEGQAVLPEMMGPPASSARLQATARAAAGHPPASSCGCGQLRRDLALAARALGLIFQAAAEQRPVTAA